MQNYVDENDHENVSSNGKLRGVATPKGKKIVFKSPAKTPSREYEKYNAHWSYDEYINTTTTDL